MSNTAPLDFDNLTSNRLGPVVQGLSHQIRGGFTANHFSEDMFAGAMDPLLMVDHFVMTAPTFAPHVHAGLSAVTAMFEDSQGDFLNRDTLGHNVALKAGDLYWLAAARGASHEEKPAEGARIHALQIFVNLPGRLKQQPARALHVKAGEVPSIEGPGSRVRVVLGRTGDVVGEGGTPEEMTLLDGAIEKGASFTHRLLSQRQAWIYAVSGSLTVGVGQGRRTLKVGTATTVSAGDAVDIVLKAGTTAHFVVLAGMPIHD